MTNITHVPFYSMFGYPRGELRPVQIPMGSQILGVGMDRHSQICLHIRADVSRQKEPITVFICGDGDKLSPAATTYVGAVTFKDVTYHVFVNTPSA